ncbi:DUF397 domain-containing protein [Actinoplanes sp. L3-i22]|uniref:DUF397 domain-containing protein n=1 Tax=Actinoplanes sp. L3-i22 TaxID=2836373 RepID=UPI001C76C647|nr:DUF397 domain-containing protein [Actinoplanes sp. L3-i22]BCY11807.1 hypothetical protein L3i22_068950 [Actinoplanes sp. L3-i22]
MQHSSRQNAEQWITSSACTQNNCVQVAAFGIDTVAVRDSKDPDGAILSYTTDEWRDFIIGAKRGEFDFLFEG